MDFKESINYIRKNPGKAVAYAFGGLIGSLIALGTVNGLEKISNDNEKTQTEFVDTSKVESFNYSRPMDSVYRELGIDKTKYTQKQLDSLVSEAYQNILW